MNTLHPTTKLVNEDQPMTLFGEKTPRAVIYKSESNKLHQAFCVKKDKIIHQGMPVALDTEGNIEPFIPGGDDSSQVYLGIAVTDNINPAYQAQRNFPVEVTVAVEAFMVVNWVAKETMECGYVKPTDKLLIDRFITAEASKEETKFISIVPADEANDIIQVLVR